MSLSLTFQILFAGLTSLLGILLVVFSVLPWVLSISDTTFRAMMRVCSIPIFASGVWMLASMVSLFSALMT